MRHRLEGCTGAGYKKSHKEKKLFIHSKTLVMKGFGAKRKKFVSIQSIMAEP